MNDQARVTRNMQMLQQCNPLFADRVRSLIAAMEQAGYRPRIQQAWRSPQEQREAYRKGHSSVTWGFHCAVTAEGKPDALAVDLLDDDDPLRPRRGYLMRLASLANTYRLRTGLFWGLDTVSRTALLGALRAGEWDYGGKIGWDPTHVEPADLTVAQAERGDRLAEQLA